MTGLGLAGGWGRGMPVDVDYGPKIFDSWGRHPRLCQAASWITFTGRQSSLRRAAIERLDRSGDAVRDLAPRTGLAGD